MEHLLEIEGATLKSVMRGDVIEGLVVGVEPDELLIDIGLKAEGVVPERELWDTRSEEPRPDHAIGDKVLVYVVQPEGDGPAVLSIRRAAQEKVWRVTQDLFDNGTIIEATVLEYNKGGVLVDVGPRGFVPLSQLTSLRRGPGDETEEELNAKLEELIETKINVKIIELDRRRNRLILSERVAQREMRAQRREVLLEELQVGQIRKGVVSNICSFGAFIDLGGADGLAHISELSWSRVESPEDVLSPGQDVDVYILSLDREEKKIALSLRRAQKDPWAALEERYTVNQVVEGEVTKLAPFGAFVRLEDGIEGLAHASDLGDTALDSLTENQTGKFQILSIDPSRRRIRLVPVDIDAPLDDALEAQGALAAVAEGPTDEPAESAEAPDEAEAADEEPADDQADSESPEAAEVEVAATEAEAEVEVAATEAEAEVEVAATEAEAEVEVAATEAEAEVEVAATEAEAEVEVAATEAEAEVEVAATEAEAEVEVAATEAEAEVEVAATEAEAEVEVAATEAEAEVEVAATEAEVEAAATEAEAKPEPVAEAEVAATMVPAETPESEPVSDDAEAAEAKNEDAATASSEGTVTETLADDAKMEAEERSES